MFLFQYISFKFARLGLVIFYVFLGVACSAPDSELADQASQLNKTSKSIRLDTLFETLAEQGFQGQDDRLFQGGEKFSYSNSNYIALALIIEIASGQTFAEYLTDNVFKPLGMLHTSSFTERFTSGDIPTNYAFGYVTNEMGEMELPESLPSNKFLPVLSTLEGDGTVIGRLNDFSKWEPAWTTDILIGARLRQTRTFRKIKNFSPLDLALYFQNDIRVEHIR